MRRGAAIASALVCLAVGCGIDFIGSAPIGNRGGGGDGGASDGASDGGDYFLDGSAFDAGGAWPDAGVPFVPSHIGPVYSLAAPDVMVPFAVTVELDTSARTIKVGPAGAAVSPNIVHDGDVAVWSVGSLSVSGTLRVTGERALVIVAARDARVEVFGAINVAAERTTPGAGGRAASLGLAAGKNGTKAGEDASGGGGAGHAQTGGKGGDVGAQDGGAGGPVTNATGALLVGGAGGGNGGGSVAGGCGGRGAGGGGGGALQISSVGRISVSGNIHLGGGGGRGGCRNNGGDAFTGGGGGGAGGVLFLEAVAGVDVVFPGLVAALGGGGGEGGDDNGHGNDGDNAPQSATFIALGGNGQLGAGNGGVGGTAFSTPGAGDTGSAGGGGGGAAGFVFLRTRGGPPSVSGAIAAIRVDQPF